MGDIVFELDLRVVVDFVGGLEYGMGATHFRRFMLVGSCAFVDSRSVAALEAFLVGDDDGTRNDGGYLFRSQGHLRALNTGRSGLRAFLGRLYFSSLNVRRSVRYRNVERRMFER